MLRRSDGAEAGRPPADPTLLFKLLVRRARYGLSDEQAEFQIRDRLSFMRFRSGLGRPGAGPLDDLAVPGNPGDGWSHGGLFARFDRALTEQGYFALGGQLIDASIVEASRQRLTVGEKQVIRSGERPDRTTAKARHNDLEARWVVTRRRVKRPGPTSESREQLTQALLIPALGYESHINTDRRRRPIRRFQVAHAAAHDGARLVELVNPEAVDSRVGADTACRPMPGRIAAPTGPGPPSVRPSSTCSRNGSSA